MTEAVICVSSRDATIGSGARARKTPVVTTNRKRRDSTRASLAPKTKTGALTPPPRQKGRASIRDTRANSFYAFSSQTPTFTSCFFSFLRVDVPNPPDTRGLMPSPRIPHYSSPARARRAPRDRPPALGEPPRMRRRTKPFWIDAHHRGESRAVARRRDLIPPLVTGKQPDVQDPRHRHSKRGLRPIRQSGGLLPPPTTAFRTCQRRFCAVAKCSSPSSRVRDSERGEVGAAVLERGLLRLRVRFPFPRIPLERCS